MSPIPFSLCLLSLFAPALAAQEAPSPQDAIHAGFEQWQSDHSGDWILRTDEARGAASGLFGNRVDAPFAPETEADWFELGRIAFDQSFEMFGLEDEFLTHDSVNLGYLESIGQENKMSVIFGQSVNGVPVVRSWATAIFTPAGDLLALDSTALPHLDGFSTTATRDRFSAVSIATHDYREHEGRDATQFGAPKLVILADTSGKVTTPRLAWSIELRTPVTDGVPSGRNYYVAADGSADIVSVDELIHHQSLRGNVQAYATPGTKAGNTATQHPVQYARVTSSAGNTTTDAAGNFSINYSGSSSVNVKTEFYGDWCYVMNDNGSEHTLTQAVTVNTPMQFVLNPSPTELITSQADAYDSINDFHNWVKATDANDNHMDFRARANVNLNSTCNAYYNGNSTNYYMSGGGCANTAFSTVVAHEQGHWANDKYSSGNGSDGFGEGMADVWSMYIYDTPIVGEGFSTWGNIRTGTNTRQFCGDGNGGCYGQVHADGEVLMGALWKVRRNLNTTNGNAAGDLIADTICLAWMNLYNDGTITTAIEDHWLIINDDNGNVGDGTPDYSDIDAGFREQGFPGVDLDLIQLDHTPVGDQLSEVGPYVVSVDAQSLIGSTVTNGIVRYTVDGGAEMTEMLTFQGGDTWAAGIPGQVSPASVAYHIEMFDALGNDERHPDKGEHEFIVGVRNIIYFNDFEGATDEGWAHAQIATQDDWQRGAPQGQGGDPGSAYSGNNCWGNDLGPSGWNGLYQPNVNNYLDSPSFDCSGYTNVRMGFKRWLNVEESQYDSAHIRVEGTKIWENAYSGNHSDQSWTTVEYDISQYADNNNDVVVRFKLLSDGGLELGGWNIDDFMLYTLEPVPGNQNSIQLSGTTNGTAGSGASWTLNAAPGNAPYWLLYSMKTGGSVISGHQFDIGSPWFIGANGTTNAAGSATVNTTLPGNTAGLTIYLEAAASSGGVFDSNMLTLTIQ